MIIVYGTTACPMTMKALSELAAAGTEYEFRNFAKDTQSIKDFLALRDQAENAGIFDSVRQRHGIGIPLFVTADGKVTAELEEAVKRS